MMLLMLNDSTFSFQVDLKNRMERKKVDEEEKNVKEKKTTVLHISIY